MPHVTQALKLSFVVAREQNFSEDRLSRLRYDNTAGDAGIPVIAISRQAAETLLNKPVTEIEQAAKSKSDLAYAEVASPISLSVDIIRKEVPAYNVVGVLEGSDPVLKNENIVIGAHYDHLGRGGEGSGSLSPNSADIHHGADDNASGTAGLLELARIFSSQQPKPKRTLIFIAFGGEEEGLLGSAYYVNHPLTALTNTVAMINMDMIGRMRDRKLVIGGVGTAQGVETDNHPGKFRPVDEGIREFSSTRDGSADRCFSKWPADHHCRSERCFRAHDE